MGLKNSNDISANPLNSEQEASHGIESVRSSHFNSSPSSKSSDSNSLTSNNKSNTNNKQVSDILINNSNISTPETLKSLFAKPSPVIHERDVCDNPAKNRVKKTSSISMDSVEHLLYRLDPNICAISNEYKYEGNDSEASLNNFFKVFPKENPKPGHKLSISKDDPVRFDLLDNEDSCYENGLIENQNSEIDKLNQEVKTQKDNPISSSNDSESDEGTSVDREATPEVVKKIIFEKIKSEKPRSRMLNDSPEKRSVKNLFEMIEEKRQMKSNSDLTTTKPLSELTKNEDEEKSTNIDYETDFTKF